MKEFHRCILFSETPLNGKFRYKDLFQIIPLKSSNAPKSPYNRHFPLFLEYTLELDKEKFEQLNKDPLDKLIVKSSLEKEILELLTVFSNHRFFRYQDTSCWGIISPAKKFEELEKDAYEFFNNQYSSWVTGCYIYPNLYKDLNITGFTNDEFENIKIIPYYEYFTIDPVENEKGEITFPETMEVCLEKYFNLNPEFQKRVKSAIRLINIGVSLPFRMYSIEFLSYVSSIETMISIEMDDENFELCPYCKTVKKSLYKCHKCKSPIWGIRKKFTEYLSKFVVSGTSSQKKYKKIYDFRSKIAHTGQLFISDLDETFDEMEIKNEEWLINLETLQLARMNIVNWLRCPKNKANR